MREGWRLHILAVRIAECVQHGRSGQYGPAALHLVA